jgi:predicted Rossmann-fold nucleotide-binding protein
LPTEQQPNPYITPELNFQLHYFAMRKMHLAMRSNALAIFPGGFGAMDEMFELLTLQQTRKAPPAPVVLFGAYEVGLERKSMTLGLVLRSDIAFLVDHGAPSQRS